MEQLITIKTLTQLEELTEYIKGKDFIAYDTETTGTTVDSKIIGFSVCADIEIGYYVVLSYWDPEQKKLIDRETKKGAKSFLEKLKNKSLVMQNAPFDCSMTNLNFGIELMPYVVHDTMIGGHILNENRANGLKERGVELYGEDARAEQKAMKESVHKNGGVLTKDLYELYKADEDLMAFYGAKDAILTLKVFYNDVPQIYEEKLDKFFYDEESMALLRGPTYDMNTSGLKIDVEALQKLKKTLEVEILEDRAFINKEIAAYVKEKYPGTGKTNHFNIDAPQQRSWLLYSKLGNTFNILTKVGREVCKKLGLKLPYTQSAKREFIHVCESRKGDIWEEESFNHKTGKKTRAKKIANSWTYMACGKESLIKLSKKYKWVEAYLRYAKNVKLLNTYVEGIQSKLHYGIIYPSFLQHGTTSGRYSSRKPNFQNLPRDDKRIKSCIVARPGNVLVGADYSQLEPRVFASLSGDKRLLDCFKTGDDFYSVIGVEVFDKQGMSLKKNEDKSFAKQFPQLRDIAKVVALSATYGTTAPKMSPTIGKSIDEAQEIIDNYFERFPSVQKLMLESHALAKKNGSVTNLFGRPRRMPKALLIEEIYGNANHERLPYEARNTLNLAVNHRVQSTAASIMNRAAIAVWKECSARGWDKVKIVLQVHDQLILEGPEKLGNEMAEVLKRCMEETTKLPGVDLVAEPFISKDLAGQK